MSRRGGSKVVVRVIPGAVDRIARSSDTRDYVQDYVDRLADTLKPSVPVRSGRGRKSVKGRVAMGARGWYGTASWDEQHYYLGILNSRMHFADAAIARIRYV